MNIGSLPTRHARYRPDHLGFVFEDQRLSHRAFNGEVNRLCNAMLGDGIKKGDHVFAALSNSFELMALYWMAAKTGIVIVPASTLLQTAGLKSRITDSDSVMVFADARFAETLNEIGEICGRAPVLMPGYYKRPDLTEQAIVDGWLLTGDVGYVDEEGFLYLVDRIKDMIISGGVNVYPKDIEEVLNPHDEVIEAAVFGAPSEKWGECPVAVVRLAEGSTAAPEALMAWTNENVGAKFQRLHDLLITEQFPRTMAGKTLKRELQQRYVEEMQVGET